MTLCSISSDFEFISTRFLIPIIVAVLTYFIVDRLGVWRDRRMYSKLGIAIIESLQEEINTGIKVMTNMLDILHDEEATGPSANLLPTATWSGRDTIPNEVMIRIIEASTGRDYDDFPPKDSWIHCKNYFEHMSRRYNSAVEISLAFSEARRDWRTPFQNIIENEGETFIDAAKKVHKMLEEAKTLLAKNAKAWFPK